MSFLNWKYWQWMLAAVVVGSAAVALHKWSTGEMSGAAVPVDLSGEQQRFETALFGSVEGHALLREITVSPRRVLSADGSMRTVHVIEAEYCTGEVEEHGGRGIYKWRNSRFVLPVPYRLQTELSDLAVSAAYVKRIKNLGNPTVLDLLAAVKTVRKSGYSYSWWDVYPWPVFGGGSVLLIGLVFPVVIRLATYGRLTQPAPKEAPAKVPAAEPLAVAPSVPEPPAHAHEPEPVRDASEFGMKKDDYYPTERRVGKA